MANSRNHQIQTLHYPTWCPGCGNYGVFTALKQVLNKSTIPLTNYVVVYDVGCCGNMNDFLHINNFHTLHGRAIPVAEGIKLANHELKVIVVIGDGGCYGEGVQHLIASARGNHDITVIVHNNELYALTTGQASPTTEHMHKTKTTPDGVIELPFNPILQMIASGASFVARGYSAQTPQLVSLIQQGLDNIGFSLIDVIQPCVSFNSYHDYAHFNQKVYDLKTINHDPKSRSKAIELSCQHPKKIPTGLFYHRPRPAYHQNIKLIANKPLVQLNSQITLNQLYNNFT